MKLLADENIPDELVDLLRSQGYDVSEATAGTPDTLIAKLAKKERRILLTQDKDFADILTYPPQNFHGIIRFKFHPPVIADMLRALEELFHKYPPKQLEGKLVVLEKTGFRIR